MYNTNYMFIIIINIISNINISMANREESKERLLLNCNSARCKSIVLSYGVDSEWAFSYQWVGNRSGVITKHWAGWRNCGRYTPLSDFELCSSMWQSKDPKTQLEMIMVRLQEISRQPQQWIMLLYRVDWDKWSVSERHLSCSHRCQEAYGDCAEEWPQSNHMWRL